MIKLERLFLNLVLGAILPITGFLAGWWGTYSFLTNAQVFMAAGAGLLLGLILDFIFMKKWIAAAWQSNLWIWMAVFLFYSICTFGFFMGVPVPNLGLAVLAGIYVGRRLANTSCREDDQKRLTAETAGFTTLVFFFICASSAYFALRDPTTGANLQGMFRLPFEVTLGMVIALIMVGGAAVLALNWWLTVKSIRITSHLTRW